MQRLALGVIFAVTACGSEDPGPPPIAVVPGAVEQLAVNDTSIFAYDASAGVVHELGRDGSMIATLPTSGAVRALVAHGAWVAWIEAEGSGEIIRRRHGTAMDSIRATSAGPHLVATAEGLVYSDATIVALWLPGVNPERIASPATAAKVIGADQTYAYTVEADTSVVKYPRGGDVSEVLLPASMDATVKDGQLAHRTAEGIRERDLFTGFDRVVGMPPSSYPCALLIAGRAVMCGRYRSMDGMTDALLAEAVGAYASIGKEVWWVKLEGDSSAIHLVDAELREE